MSSTMTTSTRNDFEQNKIHVYKGPLGDVHLCENKKFVTCITRIWEACSYPMVTLMASAEMKSHTCTRWRQATFFDDTPNRTELA